MVVVGGVTRLTHSGLSIVEWQPLVGTIPPLNDAQWEESFGRYRETPEFKLRNHDMTVEGFKSIFWWEYFHRLLGRVIGVAFLVPFAFFVATGALRGAPAWRLSLTFLLGGLQGALGWYMVQSGLVDDPRVSSARLAAHLALALLIYALLFWTALTLVAPHRTLTTDEVRRRAGVVVFLVFCMAISGAFVAGLRAGFAYNTWPLMDGHFIPPEILQVEPWWMNFLHNMATVQFVHRILALVTFVMVVLLWLSVRHEPPNRRARFWSHALAAAAVLQVAVGIATLLLKVPLALAALHQAGAVVVLSCALGARHALREAPQLHS
jgi:cytochrome c oxidase assembly protein subunit 15